MVRVSPSIRTRLSRCSEQLDDARAPAPAHGEGRPRGERQLGSTTGSTADRDDTVDSHDVRAMHAHELRWIELLLEPIERRPHQMSLVARDDGGVDVVSLDVVDRLEGDDHVRHAYAGDEMRRVPAPAFSPGIDV